MPRGYTIPAHRTAEIVNPSIPRTEVEGNIIHWSVTAWRRVVWLSIVRATVYPSCRKLSCRHEVHMAGLAVCQETNMLRSRQLTLAGIGMIGRFFSATGV